MDGFAKFGWHLILSEVPCIGNRSWPIKFFVFLLTSGNNW